jgi:subtilisin-like proprotein convertase family protein
MQSQPHPQTSFMSLPKSSPKFALALLFSLLGSASQAGVIITSGAINTAIPDDSATGLTSTLNVTELFLVSSVTVNLNLSVPVGQTGWSGDLYVYLQHDSGLSVLLNRPGRTSDAPFGYGDSQPISITVSDAGANGDLHTYRPEAATALTGTLSGSWQPDGRASDPDAVLTSSPRSATLSQFNGLNSAGTWTLFVADLSGGGRYQLDSWALQLQAVPEPGEYALIAGLTLGIFACWRSPRRSGEAQR